MHTTLPRPIRRTACALVASVIALLAGPFGARAQSPSVTTQLAMIRREPAARALPHLRALLKKARADTDSLGAGHVLAAIGVHLFRRARPSRPEVATVYFDSAALVFRDLALTLRKLPDSALVQLAEQLSELQQESTLAWLAQSGRRGARTAALAALAVADRGRGQAFDILARRGYGDVSLSNQIVMRALPESAPQLGEALVNPRFTYGTGPAILAYLHADDTLITWLRVPGTVTKPGPIHLVRRAISRDSLATLVTGAREALGAGSTGARGLPALEPASARTRTAGVTGEGIGDPTAAFAALKALLLPPQLTKEVPAGGELLVVASGALAAVPFAALPADAAGTPISARYAVRYSTSLHAQDAFYNLVKTLPHGHLYASGTERDSLLAIRRAWLARAVVVGNPVMPTVDVGNGQRQALAPLPGAETEADSVAGMMGVAPLTQERATLAAVRARADSATVVHLATHGFAYGTEDKVGDSFVALAPEGSDDGLLTVGEMLTKKVLRFSRAELVVLSACQTGLGQLTASEGTLGLQRAFLAAGASTVLVSLWSVSDEATSLLLRNFYRHWLTDPDAPTKAESLRRAQEAVRADPRFSHPRFWAAFQLVGAA